MSEDSELRPPEPETVKQQGWVDLNGTSGLFKVVIAQASFIAALMFYLGAIYSSSYYGYFHLSLSTLNFGFSQLVLQSLHLLKLEALVVIVILLIVAGAPWVRTHTPPSGHVTHYVSRASAAAARFHLLITVAGLVLLIMWPYIQPYGWVAPLTIACGLLMGQCRDARGHRPEGFRRRAVPIFGAGVFLFWTLTQVALQQGEQDAQMRARHVNRWTGVLVLSTTPLSLPTDSVPKEVLPGHVLHRYRYSDLRLLAERDGRYFVVPRTWNARTDAIYIIRESDSIWMALTPGTLPPH